MSALLAPLAEVSTLVFAVASMLTVGLSYNFAQILAPLRDVLAVLRTLLANFVLVPLLAVLIIRVLPLENAVAIGLMLLATAAGAPFLLMLKRITGGDIGTAAGLLVLMLVASMAYMPIVMPLLAPGIRVDALAIASPLALTMLLPLIAGLVIDTRLSRLADRLRPITGKLTQISLIALVASLVALHLQGIRAMLGFATVLAVLAFLIGAYAIGKVLGGRGSVTREALALGTAQRNIGAALVVATQSFDDPAISLMVVFTSLVGLALLFPLAWRIRKRRSSSRTTAAGRGREDPP